MSSDNGVAARPVLDLRTPVSPAGHRTRHEAASGLVRTAPLATDAELKAPRPARVTTGATPVDTLAPREIFLAQLHREKRRVDRSKAPLSLAIYRMAQRSNPAATADLALLLLQNKRETDIAGWLGDDVLAVICPDTGNDGVHRFIEKIDAASGDLRYSVECATYPDQIFEGLSAPPAHVHGHSPLLAERAPRDIARDGYWLKRPLDIIGALVAILLFSPVMLATALAVKLTSRGPVIFRQTRLGRSGAPFVFYKFRSMTVNNDDRIHREYVKGLILGTDETRPADRLDSEPPVYKIKADPRVTSVGRFIRKTSIDELPQFFNVLKGDMSLVGPRPPMPYEAENYQSWHLRRVLDIKPGITGLWQVEGRSRVTFDEMVRMDLRYIRGCSLTMDLRILLRTFLVVLRCEGAS